MLGVVLQHGIGKLYRLTPPCLCGETEVDEVRPIVLLVHDLKFAYTCHRCGLERLAKRRGEVEQ